MQRSNFANGYLPCATSISVQASAALEEIRRNLSRSVEERDSQVATIVWSEKLKDFLSLYGFHFSKDSHLQLIHFYLSIVENLDLSYPVALICFELLGQLTFASRLIHRDELTIDWKIFSRWTQQLNSKENQEKIYGLAKRPKDLDIEVSWSGRCCSSYFPVTATEEMLEELRPQFCLVDWESMYEPMGALRYFLPVHLPPDLHDRGFKLWFPEFFDIWLSIPNDTLWESRLVDLFAHLSWSNIGSIDWQPYLPQIFTRFLRGFALPLGEEQKPTSKYEIRVTDVARWIVSMIGNGSPCLFYLSDLLRAMKTFFHPSNSGKFQNRLVEFIRDLGQFFVDRLHLEGKETPVWYFSPPVAYRLSSSDTLKFSECLEEYLSLLIFIKVPSKELWEACQFFSLIRPECFVPMIIDKLFSSLDGVNEARRYLSLLRCCPRLARQLVRQSPSFPQGQRYVLPLLIGVLPGIDWNDFEKSNATLEFLETLLALIQCVDCSSAVDERDDLTEIEKEVCLSTRRFPEFIMKLFDRIFEVINVLSAESSEALTVSEDPFDSATFQTRLNRIITHIVQQCSDDILQIVREKVMKLFTSSLFPSSVRWLVLAVIRPLIQCHPVQTLKDLLPRVSQSILSKFDDTFLLLLDDDRGNVELIWELSLFGELLRARGESLLLYRESIHDVLHRSLRIVHQESNELVARSIQCVFHSLVNVYSIHSSPPLAVLPIRVWGQAANLDELQIQYHIPTREEIDFALDLLESLIEPELALLKKKLSKDERRRSLKIVESLMVGSFRLLPPIESETWVDPSPIPLTSQSQNRYSLYYQQLHSHLHSHRFAKNFRLRLLQEMETLLDSLVEDQSDDILSLNTALAISVSSAGLDLSFAESIRLVRRSATGMANLLENSVNGKRDHPRALTVKQIELQFQEFESPKGRRLTEIDKEVALKLFHFSLHRYSEVRRSAQRQLFVFLSQSPSAFEILVDPIVEVLKKMEDEHHDQLKGCLYVLLGGDGFFFLTQSSWSMRNKLWPLLVRQNHTKKISIGNLIRRIQVKIEISFVTESISEQPTEIEFYHQLIETLCSFLKDETCTWGQKKMSLLFVCLLLQKRVSIPSSCIDTCLDFLVHPNAQLRKYAAKSVAAFCHSQKPPRMYVEKSLEEIFRENGQTPPVKIGDPGNRDDNRWLTFSDIPFSDTQSEWEERCFLDRLSSGYHQWPKTIKYAVNKRQRYTEEQMPSDVAIIFQRFRDENFVKRLIEKLVLDDDETDSNRVRFLMFKGLFRNFGLAFLPTFVAQLDVLIRETTPEKKKGSHRAASEIVIGLIRGSKYWTLPMLDELWQKLTPFLSEVCNGLNDDSYSHWVSCFRRSMENQDPRRMSRLIEFIRSLIDNSTRKNNFAEASRWDLIRSLEVFHWRIPSLWCIIHDQAKELLDHPSQLVRIRIASILSVSLGFALTSFEGKSADLAQINRSIDAIGQRLQQAIDIYQRKPLVSDTDQRRVELDFEARGALNLIETVIDLHTKWFTDRLHPINGAIIRLFPFLCEIESLVANDLSLKNRLIATRLCIGMTHMDVQLFEVMIEQLEKVCTTTNKWNARRVAMEFLPNLIFCNLFNARPYASRLHQMVLKCLFDEQLEVRLAASATLASFYQCGYLQITKEDLQHFLVISETNYLTGANEKRVISTKDLLKRHGGILGLQAVILSSPYDISKHLPTALILLCQHSHDPYLIQKSIKECLSEFRRTHYDSWHEHRTKFTTDQLSALADTLIAHSYYV